MPGNMPIQVITRPIRSTLEKVYRVILRHIVPSSRVRLIVLSAVAFLSDIPSNYSDVVL